MESITLTPRHVCRLLVPPLSSTTSISVRDATNKTTVTKTISATSMNTSGSNNNMMSMGSSRQNLSSNGMSTISSSGTLTNRTSQSQDEVTSLPIPRQVSSSSTVVSNSSTQYSSQQQQQQQQQQQSNATTSTTTAAASSPFSHRRPTSSLASSANSQTASPIKIVFNRYLLVPTIDARILVYQIVDFHNAEMAIQEQELTFLQNHSLSTLQSTSSSSDSDSCSVSSSSSSAAAAEATVATQSMQMPISQNHLNSNKNEITQPPIPTTTTKFNLSSTIQQQVESHQSKIENIRKRICRIQQEKETIEPLFHLGPFYIGEYNYHPQYQPWSQAQSQQQGQSQQQQQHQQQQSDKIPASIVDICSLTIPSSSSNSTSTSATTQTLRFVGVLTNEGDVHIIQFNLSPSIVSSSSTSLPSSIHNHNHNDNDNDNTNVDDASLYHHLTSFHSFYLNATCMTMYIHSSQHSTNDTSTSTQQQSNLNSTNHYNNNNHCHLRVVIGHESGIITCFDIPLPSSSMSSSTSVTPMNRCSKIARNNPNNHDNSSNNNNNNNHHQATSTCKWIGNFDSSCSILSMASITLNTKDYNDCHYDCNDKNKCDDDDDHIDNDDNIHINLNVRSGTSDNNLVFDDQHTSISRSNDKDEKNENLQQQTKKMKNENNKNLSYLVVGLGLHTNDLQFLDQDNQNNGYETKTNTVNEKIPSISMEGCLEIIDISKFEHEWNTNCGNVTSTSSSSTLLKENQSFHRNHNQQQRTCLSFEEYTIWPVKEIFSSNHTISSSNGEDAKYNYRHGYGHVHDENGCYTIKSPVLNYNKKKRGKQRKNNARGNSNGRTSSLEFSTDSIFGTNIIDVFHNRNDQAFVVSMSDGSIATLHYYHDHELYMSQNQQSLTKAAEPTTTTTTTTAYNHLCWGISSHKNKIKLPHPVCGMSLFDNDSEYNEDDDSIVGNKKACLKHEHSIVSCLRGGTVIIIPVTPMDDNVQYSSTAANPKDQATIYKIPQDSDIEVETRYIQGFTAGYMKVAEWCTGDHEFEHSSHYNGMNKTGRMLPLFFQASPSGVIDCYCCGLYSDNAWETKNHILHKRTNGNKMNNDGIRELSNEISESNQLWLRTLAVRGVLDDLIPLLLSLNLSSIEGSIESKETSLVCKAALECRAIGKKEDVFKFLRAGDSDLRNLVCLSQLAEKLALAVEN